ncbi:hypothetical protein LSCM1_08262 [Leishmania martiniquensis]|uniref:Amino acid transporter transmembrane domain-containing protein n=1 Tax=Leishmania martiniquensis TaxID=1580590 RepID=A0A836GTL3_9TRYP|nr:hypothetical protein LSCM1_08262 [Leishmania martiniquensis]
MMTSRPQRDAVALGLPAQPQRRTSSPSSALSAHAPDCAPPSSQQRRHPQRFHIRRGIREDAACEVLDAASLCTGPPSLPAVAVARSAERYTSDGTVFDIGSLTASKGRRGDRHHCHTEVPGAVDQSDSRAARYLTPLRESGNSSHHDGGGDGVSAAVAGMPARSEGEAPPRDEGSLASRIRAQLSQLGGGAFSRWAAAAERLVPPGGHLSNVFNLASNTLGIGIVSMASGFHATGVCLAVALMVVCAVLVSFSFYLIGVTCERSPYRSWESACRGILFPGADYIAAGVMLFFQFGTMVGFVTAMCDLLVPFVQSGEAAGISAPDTISASLHRGMTVLVWAVGMLPLCLPRRVASLRFFSIVGVTLVIFFVLAVVVHASMAGLPHVHELKRFSTGIDAVNGLTLFIFAFLGHGLCFRLFDEMRTPSARHLCIDGCGSIALIGVLYVLVGFFGYAEFGPDIGGSIFKQYHVRSDPMMLAAYIGILLKICVAYALSGQACRLPIYYILKKNLDVCSRELHLSITVPLCASSLALGMLVPDINVVFHLLGSICGGVFAFLMPAYFVMYLGGWTLKRVGWARVGMTYLNIITGVVAVVFGTAMAIRGAIHQDDGEKGAPRR